MIKSVRPNFKASDGWVRKFMKRNDLVLRARTHISQTLPKELEHKITAFHREVASIFEHSDFALDYVCNMDETPVFLDLVPNRVVDRKGKKTITVRTTASEKNRITATLCCSASGKMLPPFVVFKGKTKRGIRKVPVPHDVVCTTQVEGWMDEERMLEWIQKVWAPYVDGNRALLSLDRFSGHLTDKGRTRQMWYEDARYIYLVGAHLSCNRWMSALISLSRHTSDRVGVSVWLQKQRPVLRRFLQLPKLS